MCLEGYSIHKYYLDGEQIDSLDLKCLLVSRGIKVHKRIYEKFSQSHRIYPDPLTCNCLILPDGIIVQITDVALHLSYLKKASYTSVSWTQIKAFFQIKTDFRLDVAESGLPTLYYKNSEICTVDFPPSSHFYDQKTSSRLPFISNAVLQGKEWLSFQCLWPCDYAISGYPCQFCFSGGMCLDLTQKKKVLPPTPTSTDVAEIVEYAVKKEKSATSIQITGGSTLNPQGESVIIIQYLEAIKNRVGFENISGEKLVYTTPPEDLSVIDSLFTAGASRLAFSLEVWDETLAKSITPGKIKFAGRKRYLDALEYIAQKYGPNRACSSFVIGIEPAESFLQGAEYLAKRGIVPIASLWIPFGRPVMGKMVAPSLAFYRTVKEGLAKIYSQYGIEPPGGLGLNVCLCRDTWQHQKEILETTRL